MATQVRRWEIDKNGVRISVDNSEKQRNLWVALLFLFFVLNPSQDKTVLTYLMSNRKNEELTQDSHLGFSNGSVSDGYSNGHSNGSTHHDNNSSSEARAYVPPHLRKKQLSASTSRAPTGNSRWADDDRSSHSSHDRSHSRDSYDGERDRDFDRDSRDRLPERDVRLSRSEGNLSTRPRERPVGNTRWNDNAGEPSPFGAEKSFYGDDRPVESLKDEEIFQAMNTGINFDKYDDIPVEASGRDCPPPLTTFQEGGLGTIINRNIDLSGYDKVYIFNLAIYLFP